MKPALATAATRDDLSPPAATTRSHHAAPIAVLIFADLALVAANTEWTTITGLSTNLSKGVGWLTAVHPADQPAVISFITITGPDQTFRIVTTTGNQQWIRADINELTSTTRLIQLMTITAFTNRRQPDPTRSQKHLQLVTRPTTPTRPPEPSVHLPDKTRPLDRP